MRCMVSHRSGETGDSFIADLAVGTTFELRSEGISSVLSSPPRSSAIGPG